MLLGAPLPRRQLLHPLVLNLGVLLEAHPESQPFDGRRQVLLGALRHHNGDPELVEVINQLKNFNHTRVLDQAKVILVHVHLRPVRGKLLKVREKNRRGPGGPHIGAVLLLEVLGWPDGLKVLEDKKFASLPRRLLRA